MTALFTDLLTPASGEGALVRVFLTLLILITGHVMVKVLELLLRRTWIRKKEDLTKKDVQERIERLKYFSLLLDGFVVLGAILYLNTGITSSLVTEIVNFIPKLASVTLIGILGIILINLMTRVGSDLLEILGVHSYFREVGLSGRALTLLSGLFEAFLYLLLLQVAISQLGVGETFVDQLVEASSWAVAFLIAGLLFYGFKDLFVNFAAGIYLKNSRHVRPGEEVNMGEETGEIKEVSLFSTTLDTETGYTMMTPNSRVMESDIKFKRTKSDVETLEDMKDYFVAQNPSYCGPASMEMALDIFGYRHTQEEIGEKSGTEEGKGTRVEELMESVEELTEGEVKTAFVEYEKITDLAEEMKAWFNDGALVVPNFYKPALFPEASTGHYVLSVGVEGDELLIVDPSDTTGTGGVYFVDKHKMYEAMGEHGHTRGYIVVAPKGTTAYWRIKNDLIYSDKTYYDELSKTLETRLRKIMRQGSLLKNAMPGSIKNYMEEWRTENTVARLWESRTEGDSSE